MYPVSSAQQSPHNKSRDPSIVKANVFSVVSLLILLDLAQAHAHGSNETDGCFGWGVSFSNNDRCECTHRIMEVRNRIIGTKELLGLNEDSKIGLPVNLPSERMNKEWQRIAEMQGDLVRSERNELYEASVRDLYPDPEVNRNQYHQNLQNENELELLEYAINSNDVVRKVFPNFQTPDRIYGWVPTLNVGHARGVLRQARDSQKEHDMKGCQKLWNIEKDECRVTRGQMDRWNKAQFDRSKKRFQGR